MAVKKNDTTEDKNDSTSDKGAEATNTEKNTTTPSTKADDGDKSEGNPSPKTTLNENVSKSQDTSDVGEGDVANTEATKKAIATNKNGEKIASAPTEDAGLMTVSAEDAMAAARRGTPIVGVDLKPGDRPDVRTTRAKDVVQAGGVGYLDKETGDPVVSHRTPRSVRVVGDSSKNTVRDMGQILPTARYEKDS